MNLTEYQTNAVRTESQIEVIKGVSAPGLHATLAAVVAVGEIADQIKKNVFYGRAYNREALIEHLHGAIHALQYVEQEVQPGANFANPEHAIEITVPGTDTRVSLDYGKFAGIDPRIFHVAIGAITESAELAQAVQKVLEGQELDVANFAEEIGDLNWYINGIFPDASGIPATQTLDTNIGKLAKRYPEKFDAYLAQQENRDLDAEREILEDGVSADEQPTDGELFRNEHTGQLVNGFRLGYSKVPEWFTQAIDAGVANVEFAERNKAAVESDLLIIKAHIQAFSVIGDPTVFTAEKGDMIFVDLETNYLFAAKYVPFHTMFRVSVG